MRRILVTGVLAVAFASLSVARAQVTCATCSVPSVSAGAPPSPAVAATATPSAIAPRPDDPAAELKAIDAEFDRAMLRGDRAAVAAILDDGMISVRGYDTVTTRDKVLERIHPNESPHDSLSATDVVVTLSGDAGVVTSKKTSGYEMNGHAESRSYRKTNLYVRRAGRWKLLSSMVSDEDPPYSARDVSYELDFDASAALGDPRAGVVIYEFSDYECSFCRRFAAQTLSRVEKDYVSTGRVALVFRDYPLEMHPRAAAAAAAGLCAESLGKRWPMSDKMLRDPVALSDEDFRRYVREIGLDPSRFERCMSDPTTSEKIRRGMAQAYGFGVKGTPLFVIGVRKPGEGKVQALRMIEGAYPYEVFQTTLDGVLRARGF